MPIDTMTPQSAGWWVERLLKKLAAKRPRYDLLDEYYRNECGIPVPANQAVKQAYRRLMEIARTNYAELVVEAVRERMQPVGFMTGADGDELGDKEAWRIWHANELEADSGLVHRSSLSMGDSYVIVGGVDNDIGAPLITPEDPRQVITEEHPIRRRKAIAALKVYRDDSLGLDKLYLYLPGVVWTASRPSQNETVALNSANWEWEGVRALPEKVVPVVRFPNKADLAGRSQGEFEGHRTILDRINFGILQRLEIATLQAFRQRGIKGVPDKDEKGDPIDYDDIFSASPGALWILPETADIWESGQVDLGPVRQSVRDDVLDLAAVTRTPLFYLTPEATNGSAEGASLAREGLVFKTGDRVTQAGQPWKQVMSYAFLFAGDLERANRADMEVLWAPVERFSLAERYDAASKAGPAGVPWRAVMREVLQFSPQQTDRFESDRAADALMAALAAPPVAPAQVPPDAVPSVP